MSSYNIKFTRFKTYGASQVKNATLIYEPSLQGYSLKFDYDADVLAFFKKLIPSHLRTSQSKRAGTYRDKYGNEKDKIEWTWYFGVEYFDAVKMLFEGHIAFKLKIISKEDVERLQTEQASQSNWSPSTRQLSIEDELRKFYALIPHNGTTYEQVKELSLVDAKKLYRAGALVYHPDRNGSSAAASEKMSELNTVWNILKEVYYK